MAVLRPTHGSTQPVGRSQRQLFELPSPFAFNDGACKRECSDLHDHEPFYNACPVCLDEFSPCNYCCFGGASSMKLAWHGCPGEMTISDLAMIGHDCATTQQDDGHASTARFVDCSCLDMLTDVVHATNDTPDPSGCALFDTMTFATATPNARAFEICIVSTNDNQISFDVPLPSIVGITFTSAQTSDAAVTVDTHGGPHVDADGVVMDALTLTTYFDTTCASPVFPGYGKFPNTCPSEGWIDLGHADHQGLPDSIDHFEGLPPSRAFWFEFIDGTSVGFWPDADTDAAAPSFDPVFSKCECLPCDMAHTLPPTQLPTPGDDMESAAPDGAAGTSAPVVLPTNSPDQQETERPISPPDGVDTLEPTIVQDDGHDTSIPTAQPTVQTTTHPTVHPTDVPTPFPTASINAGPGSPPVACAVRGVAECNAQAVANCVTSGVEGVPDGSLCFFAVSDNDGGSSNGDGSARRNLEAAHMYSEYLRRAGPGGQKELAEQKIWMRRQLSYHQNQVVAIEDFIENVLQV